MGLGGSVTRSHIAVVGGGFAGLGCACELEDRGSRSMVLEASAVVIATDIGVSK